VNHVRVCWTGQSVGGGQEKGGEERLRKTHAVWLRRQEGAGPGGRLQRKKWPRAGPLIQSQWRVRD